MLKGKMKIDTKLQVLCWNYFVKFCETGNNIVPPTSQKIAIVKNKYVFNHYLRILFFIKSSFISVKIAGSSIVAGIL